MRWIAWASAGAALALSVLAAGAIASGSSSLPLTKRVISFAGMTFGEAPKAVTTIAAWSKDESFSQAQLRKWGFAGGVSGQLSSPNNPNRYGLSLVVELSSQANAKAYLKNISTSNGPWTSFAVSGIPGAIGFESKDSSQGGANVGFTVGPYMYLEGVGWQGSAANEIANKTLIAAAQQVYGRVR
jgi:hypothetical protein